MPLQVQVLCAVGVSAPALPFLGIVVAAWPPPPHTTTSPAALFLSPSIPPTTTPRLPHYLPHACPTLPLVCSHLGYVDLYGTTFSDEYIATGYAAHLALPLIRDRWRADMSEGEARALLEDCMRILWYRDTRALNRMTLAKMTAEGAVISEPYSVDTKWDFRSFVAPKAAADTGGSW